MFSDLLNKFPEHKLSSAALLNRGMSFRQTGKPELAIKDLDEFLKGDDLGKLEFSAKYEKGLCLMDIQNWSAAAQLFTAIKSEDPDSQFDDRIHYELGWAHRELKQEAESLDAFRVITEKHQKSKLAPEAFFHVAQSHYGKKEFKKAIEHYTFCRENTDNTGLAEKAAYSLARSYFYMNEFEQAKNEFESQLEEFPQGELAADALSFIGESYFKANQHALAVKAYKVAIDEIPKSATATPGIELTSRLHGAQSANLSKDYKSALEFALPIVEDQSEWEFAPEAWYEVGAAHYGLGDSDKAIEAWENVIGEFNAVGARSRFMIGEVLFGDQKYDDAIRQFKLVINGYGGDRASQDVKKWQAHAVYEAARCNFVRISETTDATSRQQLIAEANKLFQMVVQKYPDCEFVENSKRNLLKLENLK